MPETGAGIAASVVHDHRQGIAARLLGERGGRPGMTASVRAVLRDHAACRLTGVPDEDIPVACTVDDDGFHSFTAAMPCTEPRCVAHERDQRWLDRLNDRLGPALHSSLPGGDALVDALAEFEGSHFWAARDPGSEDAERAARWHPELVRLAAERFPDLPAPARETP